MLGTVRPRVSAVNVTARWWMRQWTGKAPAYYELVSGVITYDRQAAIDGVIGVSCGTGRVRPDRKKDERSSTFSWNSSR